MVASAWVWERTWGMEHQTATSAVFWPVHGLILTEALGASRSKPQWRWSVWVRSARDKGTKLSIHSVLSLQVIQLFGDVPKTCRRRFSFPQRPWRERAGAKWRSPLQAGHTICELKTGMIPQSSYTRETGLCPPISYWCRPEQKKRIILNKRRYLFHLTGMNLSFRINYDAWRFHSSLITYKGKNVKHLFDFFTPQFLAYFMHCSLTLDTVEFLCLPVLWQPCFSFLAVQFTFGWSWSIKIVGWLLVRWICKHSLVFTWCNCHKRYIRTV